MTKYTTFNLVMIFLSSLILLFIIAPLAGMFLNTRGDEIIRTAADKEVQQSIWLTLWVSFAATPVSAIR